MERRLERKAGEAMNRLVGQLRLVKAASMGAIALTLVFQAAPAFAQDTSAEGRLQKVEAQIRALQRVVFPGPDGKIFKPEITPGSPATPTVGQPATSAVTDLLARMQALEAQVAQLTGQIEENSHRLAKLEGTAGASAASAAMGSGASPAPTSAPQANLAAMSGGAAASVETPVAASGPSAARLAAVRAIVKPQTSDPGEDEYSYGFRLWEAQFYPEAEQQLKLFVDKYPRHSLISYGRNLLGRAYLDDGKPREAAQWFLQNYQADKNGNRAPDSLLYLAASMKALKDTKRACIALAEFAETYAAEARGRLKSTYDSTRNGLKCG
jgi:TolA-binding protein